jgi:hypothetical protein
MASFSVGRPRRLKPAARWERSPRYLVRTADPNVDKAGGARPRSLLESKVFQCGTGL